MRVPTFLILFLTSALAGAQPATSNAVADPLGRSTPRGTVKGFLVAARDNNYELASQFLEGYRDPKLAHQLQAVLDAALSVNLNEISDEPAGRFDAGLGAERERIGAVRVAGATLDIVLRRVNGVWLFSPETLRHIPALYDDLAPGWVERFVPAPLKDREVGGAEVWRLLALAITIPIALAIAWLIGVLALRIARSVSRGAPANESLVAILRGPLRLFLAVLLFHAGVLLLGLPLLFRQWLANLELVVGVFAVSWFAMRLIDLASSQTGQFLIRSQRTAAVSMVPLGRRIVKVAAVSLAVLAVLDNAGFDLKAILTGLGVGGIAVALAAQKTLENIFGGLAIVADQPVRVGDFCKFGDNSGTVEDIGLRSTRIRTLDRTLISVPNAAFSTMSLENFAPREKYCFHPTLQLRLDTTPAQLRQVLAELRKMLGEHPRIEPGSHVRLVGFRNGSLNLEVFSYVTTANDDEFLAIQEDLLLKTLDIVEAAGASLALPPGTAIIARDRGLPPAS
jgi:MscS family membrane protein